MSFFKKFTDEIKASLADKDTKPSSSSSTTALPPQQQQHSQDPTRTNLEPDPTHQYQHQQYQFSPQASYQPPLASQYGGGGFHPQPQHNSPPQPPRWLQQYDQASGRAYFVETTGQVRWDVPDSAPGYGSAMPFSQVPGQSEMNKQNEGKKGKDNGTRNALLAGGAGLAVGGLAVAALDDSDDDNEQHRAPAGAPPPGQYPGTVPASAGGGGDGDADSDSLREARQAYDEAAAAAADSDASSSEQEELQEAREEYEEELEED